MRHRYPTKDAVQVLTVERFAGVDFSSDSSQVDWSRSPDACNMIADEAGYPIKRNGYERVALFESPIYGLHRLGDDLLIHVGKLLCRLEENGYTTLYQGMNQALSRSFLMSGKLWILDGKTYLVYDGTECVPVRQKAFVPTTTIGSPPEGGGTTLEAVNLLTPYRINTFVGDGSSRTFQLDATEIDSDSVTCADYTIQSVNLKKGTVTLTTAPEDAGGLANVTIQFAKTVEEYEGKIDRCTIFGLYGGSNDTRVFVAGDPQEPNCDWQSGLFDPSYFPDNGYTRIGADASAIVGYLRQYDAQLVLKEDGQDAKQYLRTFSLDDNNKPAYSLKQGAEAIGAMGSGAMGVLGGVPMYLSSNGVMGVFGTDVAEYRVISPVSERIDRKLKQEIGLDKAVMYAWKERLYLAINGHCYVADGRQMSNGVPEWYYWNNIPASCFTEIEDTLWFGTQEGEVYRFRMENDRYRYYDGLTPVSAWWCTPLSPLGQWGRTKNIVSFTPVLRSQGQSSAEIGWRTEKGAGMEENVTMFSFSFASLDFSRFSFNASAAAHPISGRRRQRKVQMFQGVVKNEKAEPFGLLGLEICYTVRTNIPRKEEQTWRV
ncbi:MAG: hypothetical protein ACI4PM_03680 [Butyricicoccus sp.]